MGHERAIFGLVTAVLSAAFIVMVAVVFNPGAEKQGSLDVARISSYQLAGVQKRALVAGVGLEPSSRSQQIAHRHVSLRFMADGLDGATDSRLGSLPEQPGSLAIHAHDASGVVHLHQRKSDEPYRLSDLWAVYGISPAGLAADGWKVALWVDDRRRALDYDAVLEDREDIVVEVASIRGLSKRMPLEKFSWATAPINARG